MEAVVLHRVGFLPYFCPKQGQDFKPSAAPLYPNLGQVTPRESIASEPGLRLQNLIVFELQKSVTSNEKLLETSSNDDIYIVSENNTQ